MRTTDPPPLAGDSGRKDRTGSRAQRHAGRYRRRRGVRGGTLRHGTGQIGIVAGSPRSGAGHGVPACAAAGHVAQPVGVARRRDDRAAPSATSPSSPCAVQGRASDSDTRSPIQIVVARTSDEGDKVTSAGGQVPGRGRAPDARRRVRARRWLRLRPRGARRRRRAGGLRRSAERGTGHQHPDRLRPSGSSGGLNPAPLRSAGHDRAATPAGARTHRGCRPARHPLAPGRAPRRGGTSGAHQRGDRRGIHGTGRPGPGGLGVRLGAPRARRPLLRARPRGRPRPGRGRLLDHHRRRAGHHGGRQPRGS